MLAQIYCYRVYNMHLAADETHRRRDNHNVYSAMREAWDVGWRISKSSQCSVRRNSIKPVGLQISSKAVELWRELGVSQLRGVSSYKYLSLLLFQE